MQLSMPVWCALLLGFALTSQAGVQNSAPEAGRGFTLGENYVYDYTSLSRVGQDLDVTVECKVSLHV